MKRMWLILIIQIFVFFSASCNSLQIQECLPIYAMDTTIEITFYNTKNKNEHYEQIKKIYLEYNSLASDYQSIDQENVYDLNINRKIEGVNPKLKEMLTMAIQLKEDTKGYYNPFIGRLSHLWKDAIKNKKLPSSEDIQKELEYMENTQLAIEGDTILLEGLGNVDLGGLAKGYATMEAVEYLKSQNVANYLINAGSSNIAVGEKVKESFIISLDDAYSPKRIMLLEEKNISIGTSSGKYQNMVVDGIRYHHLLNPFTGYPENHYDSVHIRCDNSLLCDVYSTAVFMMDKDLAIEFSKEKSIDILLTKNGEIIFKTDGWKEYA